jgi:hypothetical protein
MKRANSGASIFLFGSTLRLGNSTAILSGFD